MTAATTQPFALLGPAVPFVVATCVVFALYAIRALLRWRSVPSGAWLVLDLRGPITEVSRHVPRWQRWIGRTPPPSVAEMRRVLRVAARDPSLAGVLVRFGDASFGWATAESLRDEIARLRAANVRTVAWLPFGGANKELLVATACAEIYATPPATIGPLGIAMGSTFFRSALDRLGIEVEVLSRREFKSAAESFVRDGYSEPNRMQTEALADALHRSLVRALVEGRRLSEDAARAFIDKSPVRAREAVDAKVIDGALYEDELLAKLRRDADPLPFAKLVEFDRYAEARAKRPRFLGRKKRVAIVDVRGTITTEAPSGGADRVADVAHVSAALRAAAASPSVGAVVLYVDSPGGSALASDLIAREVERLHAKKPVIAYFANVAASGGYYVAALADRIVAQPTSITGSIGVVAMRFVLGGAASKLGVSHESVKRGANAEIYSPYRAWTEDERAVLDRAIDEVYDDFVSIVARGRKRPASEIEPLARGRVYAASEALSVGLVDELGDLARAVALAAERASLDPTLDPVRVIASRKDLPPIEAPKSAARAAIASALFDDLAPWRALVRTLERESVLLFDPNLAGVDP
ncbi:MAG: signal peptide peptidase SppA [Myxococcales bacterium]|nr:signal peptide peptidase SppA [Myxococcales bacterium]